MIAHLNFLRVQTRTDPMIRYVTQDVLTIYDLGLKPQITLNHS